MSRPQAAHPAFALRCAPALALLVACAACQPTPDNPCSPVGDGGSTDGGSTDGGSTDAGNTDGGSPDSYDLVIRGAALAGSDLAHGTVADVAVEGGRIVAIGTVEQVGEVEEEAAGRWLAPAFIDSHVHLAYYPKGPELAAGGIAAAVDLAAPVGIFDEPAGGAVRGPLRLLASGPMITAVGGYPTTSWGRDGYGIECADQAEAVAAVQALLALGAAVIKLPLASGPVLDGDTRAAVVAAAHAGGVKVASHATSDAAARLAADAGVDLLAHMPTEPLSDDTLAAWADRAVVPTLHAFGGSAARANLAALRDRGTTVLYGTDFGNTRTLGIDGDELSAMAAAGMSGQAILAAGTSVPADYWGLDDLGRIQVGAAASLLLLDADPHQDPLTLASPRTVWIDGERP